MKYFLWMFFSFRARITRKQFFIFYIIPFVLIIASTHLVIIPNVIGDPQKYYEAAKSRDPVVARYEAVNMINDKATNIYMIEVLLLGWPAIALQIKRLHDINMSGNWILINLIPIVGQIGALILMCFVKGTEGTNRFGYDPSADGS